jgi:hypothetical protein
LQPPVTDAHHAQRNSPGSSSAHLPVVNFVCSGLLVAQARASAMPDATTLTVPFPIPATALAPNLPGLAAGTVTVQVYLQTGTASYSLLGSTMLEVDDTQAL